MGRNNSDFNGVTFQHHSSHPSLHELEAFDPSVGDVVGYMSWKKDGGRVADISVDEEHRRKGVATALWRHAKALSATSGGTIASPIHSAVQTPSGAQWVKAVGD